MIRNKMNYSAVIFSIMAMAEFAGSAHAAVATANVPINMPVAGSACSVTNSNTSITLATVTSPTITTQAYLTANGITTAAQTSNFFTSAALNQTATISCNLASTAITSIDVTPGTNAKLPSGQTGAQLLVDSAATPGVAGGVASGNGFIWTSELVSVNGASVLFSFYGSGGNTQAYTQQFSTGPLSGGTSTAVFVWRPAAYPGANSTAIGNPTGGTYSGMYQIVVNY